MNNKRRFARIAALLGIMVLVLVVFTCGIAMAATTDAAEDGTQIEETASSTVGQKAIATGIAIGFAAGGGGIGMGIAASGASEGISRQPEAEGKIRSTFMLGLVFVETAIIYALLVVILIIFVI